MIKEFENKFTNKQMLQTCERVKEIMLSQTAELTEAKSQLHTKMLSYVRDEMEMRKLALQMKDLKKRMSEL